MCDANGSLYVYGFAEEPPGSLLVGVDDAPVEALAAEGVYAIVSPTPRERVRPRRRLLSAHHRVVSTLAGEQTVLPASFGLIADSRDALLALMQEHASELREELDRLHGCVELELTLRWDVENVFEHLVSIDASLRERRNELTRLGAMAPHQLKVEIGRHVESLIAAHREEHASTVLVEIEPLCEAIRHGEPRDEAELMNIACLIGRDRLDAFRAGLERVAACFDETFAFSIKGPFAPHSFVNLNLQGAANHAAAR
jgi:hypothetical protein